MKNLLTAFAILFVLTSCDDHKENSSVIPVKWDHRVAHYSPQDSLISGSTYLSVYSQIYSQTEHRKHNLTATVSMRNANRADTIYIDEVDYFNTKGELRRSYFEKPIYIAPMETVEIIIDEVVQEGGTGANFLFDWKIKPNTIEPIFESVMISTSGTQGLSFTTQGTRIK